ncbi:hypothetical protein B0T26DRAFT_686667 [Lasiosphaeria miniovina]|uniref:Inner kinetochore subunit AME1 domain-containing protein n=1 Tax=Lasiosphaeria miniovina TaxID=1954250 RepID=A0AA40BGW3_9PEZI|nr:uncharacterized protein B0T26DRAFT_686667 [Lasiosphaeria miniovina]KAK0733991.1 hypothetical protein B0T26DRAFT_686667 [Lasiosphaeria miniovina]
MATSRQERMQERMRGAGRHQVEDVSFNFVIPVAPVALPGEHQPTPEVDAQEIAPAALGPSPTPAPNLTLASLSRPISNTSAKRKHLARNAARSSPPLPAAAAVSRRPSSPAHVSQPEIYDIPDASSPEEAPVQVNGRLRKRSSPAQRQVAPAEHGQQQVIEQDHGDPTAVGAVSPAQPPVLSSSSSRQLSRRVARTASPVATGEILAEEVTESPVSAPGSGRRRRVRISEGAFVVGSSTLLQRVLEDLNETTTTNVGDVPSSSPLERMAAARKSLGQRRSVPSRATVTGPPEPEALVLSPAATRRERGRPSGSSLANPGDDGVEGSARISSPDMGPPSETDISTDVANDEVENEGEDEDEDEDGAAEEISDREAARKLGRTRTRRSLRAPSPDLGSQPIEQHEEEEQEEETIAPKRRRRKEPEIEGEPVAKRRQRNSTQASQQSKPRRAKPVPTPMPEPVPTSRPMPKSKVGPIKQAKGRKEGNHSNGADGQEESRTDAEPVPVTVTVQRFTRKGAAHFGGDEDETDTEFLNAEIPFANRAGVNAVDVLSKLCEELIENFLGKLQERAWEAGNLAAKREQKTMHRTLEAFQEELRTRLLEHTIALDTLHALRKRVRVTQKERLSLREEILRIRAEREQVALRMDAIRIKHEAESKEALRHIFLSSAMHDIDLAVEKGHAAPELSAAERKQVDLANLELLISRVSDQACAASDGGGALKQIKEFNAFLERAATALESR